MKHTPGPWNFTYYLGMSIQEINGPTQLKSGTHLASVYTTTGKNDDPESIANACLIAAAPDLLEMCKELVEIVQNSIPVHYTEGNYFAKRDKALTVIAKAEGAPNINSLPYHAAWTEQDELDDSRR